MSNQTIVLHSFGIKYGELENMDMIFDVRNMPNPYWVDELRSLCGIDAKCSEYVFSTEESEYIYCDIKQSIIDYMNTCKNDNVHIGVHCTGGKHRSVAVVERLYLDLIELGYKCQKEHRERNTF